MRGSCASAVSHERGVALVVVLGLVALIAAWASAAAYEDMISLRRAEHMQQAVRARLASESALALAERVLADDARETQIDSLEEIWAVPTPPLPIDEGEVAGEIIDANRYLNLNDLVDDDGHVMVQAVAIVKRLFALLEIPEQQVDMLVDWMDKDQLPFGAGGEDHAYYDRDYHVKNARLDSMEELLLIRGFDAAMLRQLRQVFTVYPPLAGAISTVNVNTADPLVLMAMFPEASVPGSEDFFAKRPYEVLPQATAVPWLHGENVGRLSVASDTFMVRSRAEFGSVVVQETFLLRRQGQKLQLLVRAGEPAS